jgi:hypothetical protein
LYLLLLHPKQKSSFFFNLFICCHTVDISRTENSGKLTSESGMIPFMGFLYVDIDTKHP